MWARTERLALMEDGFVRLALKTPYPDGTKHMVFELEDFIGRLAELEIVPRAGHLFLWDDAGHLGARIDRYPLGARVLQPEPGK